MKRGKRNNFLMEIQRDNFGLAIYKHKYSYQSKTTYHSCVVFDHFYINSQCL